MSSIILKFHEEDPKKADDMLAHLSVEFKPFVFGYNPKTQGFFFDKNGYGCSRANFYIIKQRIIHYMRGFSAANNKRV